VTNVIIFRRGAIIPSRRFGSLGDAGATKKECVFGQSL
jgi:hypothetical protein